jgi:stage IV sporulation protein FB
MRFGKLYLSYTFALLFAALCLFDNFGLMFPLLLSAVLHEIGHYAVIRLLGGRVMRLSLGITGACMEYEAVGLSYADEAIIAMAGPAVNIMAAFAFAGYAKLFCASEAYFFSGVSLSLGVFNLLPAQQLDGGRILYAFSAKAFDPNRAKQILCVSTCLVILGFLCVGFFVLISTKKNFTLLLAAVWTLVHYAQLQRKHA